MAAKVYTPDGYADLSGYVGPVPRGAFPDMDPFFYGDQILGTSPLAPGEIREVFTQDGIYIINVLSEPSVQKLSDQMRDKLNAELLEAWQSEQLKKLFENRTVELNFDSTDYQWVADQVD